MHVERYRGAEVRECVGVLKEAVNAFFDRATDSLPKFVGRTPSIVVSACLAATVLVLGWSVVEYDKRLHAASVNTFLRFRWVPMLLILVLVSYFVQSFSAEKVYMFDMYKANHQHYANIFWMKEYMKAWKTGGGRF